jgi:hypothetical protein
MDLAVFAMFLAFFVRAESFLCSERSAVGSWHRLLTVIEGGKHKGLRSISKSMITMQQV